MNLSVEFFKALWLEAILGGFIAFQDGSGAIFSEHAENPTHMRRLALETVTEQWGTEYWRLVGKA